MIRACSSCGAQNRIPAEHLSDQGKCGACKHPIPPASEPIDVGPELFQEITTKAKVPVLIDFWAAWCGPCRMAAPEVHRAAERMAGRAIVLKVDTDKHPDLMARFRVRGIPTFVVMSGGRVVKQQAGLVQSSTLEQWLEQAGADRPPAKVA
jgi:thioredoxin 2